VSAEEEKEEGAFSEELGKLVGPKIAIRREELGLSQEELADLAGLHRTSISPLELGKHAPQLTNLYRIAGVLRVSPFDLLADDFFWVPDGDGNGRSTNQPPDSSSG
jgi:transcriptional regulator with XRE-family HTH domain